MCEQTEINYLDGDVVWVKLGNCWWPGEVVGPDKLPPDMSFRKPPIAVVKFFQEDSYEYVKNISNIYKYNCSRKNEFINKGLYLFRKRLNNMEKFPEDVIRAETAVGGDIEILTREEFQEEKKESYKDIFCEPSKKTPGSAKRGKIGRNKTSRNESPKVSTPARKFYKEKSDYKVHILLQPSKDKEASSQPAESATPSTSRAGSEAAEEMQDEKSTPLANSSTVSTPVSSNSGCYSCPSCPFNTSRLNVLIMHNKTHSVTYTPYTPSPVRKKAATKSPKTTPKTSKTPKTPRPRKEKTEKPAKKTAQGKKRAADDKTNDKDVKKPKTDEEIKSSLLADWDDVEEESNDESSGLLVSPEIAIGAESPSAPIPAELPRELSSPVEKKSDESTEKPECSSDSKYEFCEDEDWHVEADAGRKIPRVKNPSKRKEETKSMSFEEDIDVAKEVAELLNKTNVPELPSIPEPLKVEENFPEATIVKSPDKKPEISLDPSKPETSTTDTKPTKTIFKTKTFFRSRHSRSQDAIGKYVAEQLNAAERMDMSESEINGSEPVSSPEARESPPVEHVKVARLAPKIQLKKMKAEAAQQREKEKIQVEQHTDIFKASPENNTENTDATMHSNTLQGVLYPTQEIKPISRELPDKLLENEDNIEEQAKHTIENIELLKAEVHKDRHQTLYKTVDSIYQGNETSMPEKFLEASPEKAPEEDQVITESYELDQNQIPAEDNADTAVTTQQTQQCSDMQTINEYSSHIESVTKDTVHDSNEIENTNQIQSHVTSNNLQKCSTELSPIKSRVSPTLLKTSSHENSPILSPVSNNSQDLNLSKSIDTTAQRYMNESTASAVDALLSVSREADRVPRVISNDLPEDLFEDDIKDGGYIEDSYCEVVTDAKVDSQDKANDKMEIDQTCLDYNGILVKEGEHNNTEQNELLSGNQILNEAITNETCVQEMIIENTPSESDLQIAETLINLPSSTIHTNPSQEQQSSEVFNEVEKFLDNIPEAKEVTSEVTNEVTNEVMNEETDEVINEVTVYETNDTDNAVADNKEPLLMPSKKSINLRYETEQEKSENLNAAQSLVQMSESMDHTMNVIENNTVEENDLPSPTFNTKQNNGLEKSVEQKVALLSSDNSCDSVMEKSPKFETTSSKLLKILEDPPAAITKPAAPVTKISTIKQTTPIKQVIVPGKEKILNFDVAKSSLKNKPSSSPKQKIIIRRTGPSKNLMNINNLSEVVASPDKIILSRSNLSSQDGSSVQTFTIQASPDIQTEAKQIVIQPKIRKITKPATKLQKIKPQESLIPATQLTETKDVNEMSITDESMFDINSMPVVLSDDILTPESIEKMPIVMSDGNIISSTPPNPTNPPKLIKSKPPVIEKEKIAINSVTSKPEMKTILMNTNSDMNKSTTPNILSKSSKLRAGKPMLVIDKATGKQKLIMTKSEPIVKEVKQISQQVPQTTAKTPTKLQQVPQKTAKTPTIIQQVPQTIVKTPKIIQQVPQTIAQTPTIIQQVTQTPAKTEKFIILPSANSPRPTGRTQKIVIDPQTGKAHVLVAKGQEPAHSVADNKPVSAKLIQSSSDASTPGNTVMIITNAQGAQSRIVLTPEHEKILFPNKQQPNVSQLKAITQRITANTPVAPKTLVVTTPVTPKAIVTTTPVKTQTKIVPKQKSAIITSKGQLIVGGRITSAAHNIAPMPEIRPAPKPVPKRIVASEPKKLVQAIQKTTSEPLIFLQQKSGAVMQLTAAQFEHLQRTGQIVQKMPAPVQENKIVVQKSITIPPKELSTIPKRVRKSTTASSTPTKKLKQEIAIAPAPPPAPTQALAPSPASVLTPVSTISVPPLTSLSNSPNLSPTLSSIVPLASNTVSVSTTENYEDLDNLEELLPSTAIVRQPEVVAATVEPEPMEAQAEPVAEPCPTQLSDGQLLAVPCENFGGPPGSFYLCVEDNGTITPIDNRPLVLENNQLVPMPVEPVPVFAPQPERRDILEAALANSDVFHADTGRDEAPPDFRDLNANVSVHCRVSETSTTLNQPIMTPVEVPSKVDSEPTTVPSNLEDGLAVIGVTPHVPTSLELPITVTDPRIAPKTTDPLSGGHYGAALLASPTPELRFGAAEEPMSMPLLGAEPGKSMPILTEEGSSAESAGSPRSLRLRTPGSDCSDGSAEIPLQPPLQLTDTDISQHS